MNCGGGTSGPSWGTTNDQIASQSPSCEATPAMLHLTVDERKMKSEAKDVKEGNGTPVEVMVNAAGTARLGLEVMMRKKKQRIISGGGGGATASGSNSFAPDSDMCPRPMSWEWEMSDEDYLSKGMEEMSPSPIPSRIASFDPGSPMSTNDSDKEDSMHPFSRKTAESTSGKLFGTTTAPVASTTPSAVQAGRSLIHSVPSALDKSISNNHCGNGPFYSPSQSPLQPRHVNNQSYSSSSSPEQIKRLFYSPTQSPLQSRHVSNLEPHYSQSPSPSPSQPRHVPPKESVFSPTQSPVQNRHTIGRESPYGSSYSSVGSPSGSIRYSPNQSPVQGRHSDGSGGFIPGSEPLNLFATQRLMKSSHSDLLDVSDPLSESCADDKSGLNADMLQHSALAGQTGISRQQLINSPCPICGDRISGFHYGIFSCESCKGFFKRTVQNKKNYVCLRGASCPITTTTRKKCPACRFDKCLKRGMKLEAIREDRTRGGRSTYQCTFALPPALASCGESYNLDRLKGGDKSGDESDVVVNGSGTESTSSKASSHSLGPEFVIPSLIQEIMSVEHLWYYGEGEMQKMPETSSQAKASSEAACNADFFHSLCSIADHRLFKIVKWCKSLPLFRNVSIDDQICLLLNSWCQLLLLSCCFRSIPTPEEIRVSLGKSVSLQQARALGLGPIIERMLNLTDHLRRLRVDQYEYVCLKVIILLSSGSDVGSLKEPEKVHHAQERVIQALQTYTMSRYTDHPSKFGELLLRIPELERTCQIGKDSLSMKHREGEVPSFNLLVELLRGEH